MGAQEAVVFSGKGIKKELVLELDGGEDLFECIRSGMIAHNIERATVKEIEGTIKEGFINYFSGSNYKYQPIESVAPEQAHGKYELKGTKKELFGKISIVTRLGGKKEVVTLTKAKAAAGLKARLSFIEVVEASQ